MRPSWILFIGLALATPAGAAAPARIVISGELALNGTFDPSLEFAPGGEGWLSYSAVFGDVLPWGPHVETHLARTIDGGESFVFESVVNPSLPGTLQLIGGGVETGVWNYEVSSLVHDPDDPGREWKLFAHKIFRRTEQNFTEEQNMPGYSWIVLKTAPHPAGPWSAERALLSSGPLPPAPYDAVEFSINDLDETGGLDHLLVYSEPGAFYRDGVLYLSLTGLTTTHDRIVLLASDDHGDTWRYVGTPITVGDANQLGYLAIDGSAIAEQAGQVFLLLTPETSSVVHDGTLVFAFDDLEGAALVRRGGVPVVHGVLPAIPGLPAGRRGGQADFHESSSIGVVQPSLTMEAYPEFFRIYATRRSLSSEAPVAAPALGAVGRVAMLVLTAAVAVVLRARKRRR